jgi:hypothetical protein
MPPRVPRALVTVSRAAAAPTARPATLAHFGTTGPELRLIDALLDPQVRLLIADGDGKSARVWLSHEALITH